VQDSVQLRTNYVELVNGKADGFDVAELGKLPFYTVGYEPLPKMPFHPLVKNRPGDFAFWVFLSVIVVWAWLRVTSSKRMAKLSEGFFSQRFVDQWIRDEGLLRSDVNVWLLFTGFTVIGLVLWQLPWFVELFGLGQESPFIRFLWLFFGLVAVFFFRTLSILVTNALITAEDFASVYLFNTFLFTQVLALVLFPLSLLYAYSNMISTTVFIALTAGVFVLSFMGRLIKLLYLGLTQSNFSAVYIILYLCSLEILPLGVVYAWLGN
jgi:hypothetical protein